MNKLERKIEFFKNGVKKDVTIEELEKNPTGVFRSLMGFLKS
jgi:hypothetical protein